MALLLLKAEIFKLDFWKNPLHPTNQNFIWYNFDLKTWLDDSLGIHME